MINIFLKNLLKINFYHHGMFHNVIKYCMKKRNGEKSQSPTIELMKTMKNYVS